MFSIFSQASGMSIMVLCNTPRPLKRKISSALSNAAESELSGWIICRNSSMFSPQTAEAISCSRARVQFLFPKRVLISPLCAIIRYGCASLQVGKVFVE